MCFVSLARMCIMFTLFCVKGNSLSCSSCGCNTEDIEIALSPGDNEIDLVVDRLSI